MINQSQDTKRRNLAYYCDRFASLNVSITKKKGKAQHKPILLLSVIDLIGQGTIQENKVFVSDDLINTFNKYWNILASEYHGGLHYPFFHLQNEGFWHLEFKPGFNGLQPKTTNKLKDAVEYATLDDELFEIIQDPLFRQQLIDTLIAVWFSSSQTELEEILNINQSFQDFGEEELNLDNIEEMLADKTRKKTYLKTSMVRNAFFRKAIVYVYNYKCSVCQLKVIHSITQTIVDGAHIKPFAQFYDNTITNGICLCKNHHWAFDTGLLTIDNDYKIIVSNIFEEESPNAKSMREFQGQLILLPSTKVYYPRIDALEWHRQNVFKS